MPPTTTYNSGDILLVPYPFSDLQGSKQRPAVVVSSDTYNSRRPDLIVAAVTSQVRSPLSFGEVLVARWSQAGLIKPSVLKPVLATVEQSVVIRRLGRLEPNDRQSLVGMLRSILL